MLLVSELIDKRWHDLAFRPFVGEKCALQLCVMLGGCADNKSGRAAIITGPNDMTMIRDKESWSENERGQ